MHSGPTPVLPDPLQVEKVAKHQLPSYTHTSAGIKQLNTGSELAVCTAALRECTQSMVGLALCYGSWKLYGGCKSFNYRNSVPAKLVGSPHAVPYLVAGSSSFRVLPQVSCARGRSGGLRKLLQISVCPYPEALNSSSKAKSAGSKVVFFLLAAELWLLVARGCM